MEVYAGLAGIPVVKSSISYIDGEKGVLEYRGIPIEELAKNSNFLETSYLLVFGKLPSKEEYEKFVSDVKDNLFLDRSIIQFLKDIPPETHPMKVLQSIIPVLSAFDENKEVLDEKHHYSALVNLLGKVPTILATWKRIKEGKEIVMPDPSLDYGENFLYMISGRKPDKLEGRIFDRCLILHAEHTINASTFTAIVVVSTLADFYSAVSSAVGSLSGRLHGGANERVYYMLNELKHINDIEGYVDQKLSRKERIMGFGHRVYKTYDPRAKIIKEMLDQILSLKGNNELVRIATELEKIVLDRLKGKKIYPNIDFYSGILYSLLGIPVEFYTPVFAMARISGWIAHCKEYIRENKLFRPTQIYDGGHNIRYLPLEKR
ncbi:MAG TPA: citrate synthase [Persephonella sp.]|uniref:Citrate synthase n=1 Tax=Persephonella marina (strain DSM 14350 / EX-H1) TaxID=123214 RepID=C0QRJ9_PERMH|nr:MULTISPECIES: citrate/2-methylcitrate synthase [Persephonella]ACO03476.1 citrate synthase 2 (Citrate synthase II) [Persephonella marina EX-H1]HCB69040.1 citrate synthase [Persephonella sp.]